MVAAHEFGVKRSKLECTGRFRNWRKNFEKKFWKKNKRRKKIFGSFFFFFCQCLKSPASGKGKNRKSGIRTFQNSRTTGTGRDVRLSPSWVTEISLISKTKTQAIICHISNEFDKRIKEYWNCLQIVVWRNK